MENKKISKKDLSSAVQSIRDLLDREGVHSITELWTIGNRHSHVLGKPGHSIEFEGNGKGGGAYIDNFPITHTIKYTVKGLEFPIFNIEATVKGIGPWGSYVSFCCEEEILGYSIFDVDESGNYLQYRHFISSQEDPFGGNLEELAVL